MRINYHPFGGKGFVLPDGVVVRQGLPLAEIHLNNQLLRDGEFGIWRLMGAMRVELHRLAGQVAAARRCDRIYAIHGTTIHHAAARRLGFTVRPLPPAPYNWLIGMCLKGVLVTYHPQGKARLGAGTAPLEAMEIWMSSGKLESLYGKR